MSLRSTPVLVVTLSASTLACSRSDACTRVSVSRLKVWDVEVSKDGSTFSTEGPSALTVRGGKEVAHAVFDLARPASYGTINVPLRNQRENATHTSASLAVDLSRSRGVVFEYATNADLVLQIRHGARSHGGHHYRVTLPETGGFLRSERLRFADFAQPDWVQEADRYPLDLHDVFSFTVATFASAEVTIASLTVDGYTPVCD